MSNTSQRSFASGVVFSLGLVSASFDLVSVRRPVREVKRRCVCGECEELTPLSEQMICPKGHTYAKVDAPRALEVGGELVRVDQETLAAVKDDQMEVGVLKLQCCPAAELEAATRPGESQYRIRLNKKVRCSEQYALIKELAQGETALYGVMKVSSRVTPTPYRVVVWRDQLLLQSLERPENLADADEIEVSVTPALLELGREYVKSVVQPFNPDLLTDERAARQEALVANGSMTTVAPAAPALDLAAMLQAALQTGRGTNESTGTA